MTIRTKRDAFHEFSLYGFDAFARICTKAEIFPARVAMMGIENNWICFATISTRMIQFPFKNLFFIFHVPFAMVAMNACA